MTCLIKFAYLFRDWDENYRNTPLNCHWSFLQKREGILLFGDKLTQFFSVSLPLWFSSPSGHTVHIFSSWKQRVFSFFCDGDRYEQWLIFYLFLLNCCVSRLTALPVNNAHAQSHAMATWVCKNMPTSTDSHHASCLLASHTVCIQVFY